jgi:hypothetical protein
MQHFGSHQILANAQIPSQKDLSVIFEPIVNLFDILLKI